VQGLSRTVNGRRKGGIPRRTETTSHTENGIGGIIHLHKIWSKKREAESELLPKWVTLEEYLYGSAFLGSRTAEQISDDVGGVPQKSFKGKGRPEKSHSSSRPTTRRLVQSWEKRRDHSKTLGEGTKRLTVRSETGRKVKALAGQPETTAERRGG